MADSQKSLKPGWQRVNFGDVVRLSKNRSSDPIADGYERYIGLEHIEPENLRIRRWGNVADGVTFTSVFKPGQVLFGKRRAYQRKVAVADFSGVCSGDIYVFESKDPKVLLPELLPFICQTEAFFQYAVGTSAGSLSPRTNWTSLVDYEFTLPPPKEQRRIAELLLSIDESIEKFMEVQICGKSLLSSLLKNMWEHHPKRKIAHLIAEGFIVSPQDGNHGEKHPKASDYVENGIPFIMASDLKYGTLDLNGCKQISKKQADSLRIGFSIEGDVLLSHKGTVGSVARVANLATDYIMLTPQVTYYRTLDRNLLNPDWIYFAFQTPGFQRLLEQYGRQSTRSYVGITTQRELSIPFCEADSQNEFLRLLAKVEKSITSTKYRQETTVNLRKQVLCGVFS